MSFKDKLDIPEIEAKWQKIWNASDIYKWDSICMFAHHNIVDEVEHYNTIQKRCDRFKNILKNKVVVGALLRSGGGCPFNFLMF